MAFHKLLIFAGLLILLLACSQQNPDLMPGITATAVSSSRETNTGQLSMTSTPTPTISSTPDACSKQTIPTDNFSLGSTNTSQESLIVLESLQGEREVILVNLDGRVTKNVTSHPADDFYPRWSPNGEQIAFLSNRNERTPPRCYVILDDCFYTLFVVNPDGSGLKQLTTESAHSHSWSPDSQQIAFLQAVKSGPLLFPDESFFYGIYIIDVNGTNLRNLTNSPDFYSNGPIWSPDGKKIAFISGKRAEHQKISIHYSDGTPLLAYSDLNASEIAWAGNSTSLFFLAWTDDYRGSDIYKLDIDSAVVQRLTFSPDVRKETLSLSANSRWLAYHSRSYEMCDQIRVIDLETNQNYFVYDAYTVGEAEPELSWGTITPTYNSVSVQSIQWMPDDNGLIFSQTVKFGVILGEYDEYFSVYLDGTGLRQFVERFRKP
jgi:TolB protein